MSSVGDRIRNVRKHFNLNQADFARELGVAQSHISKLETDSQRITPQDIIVLTLKYGVNEKYIISGDGEMFIPKSDSVSYVLLRLNHTLQEAIVLVQKLIRKDID